MLHAADQPMIRDSSVGQQPLPQTAAFPSERTTNMSSPSFKVLDIINKTFVIASTPEGLTITDFHAAYERLNYEVLKKKFEENAVDVQQLLSPFIYETTSRIHNDALTNAAALASFGIIVEDFGPQTLQITHLPIILGRRVEPSIIEDVIEDIVAGSSASLDRKKDIILQRMACKASPRAGDTILFQEAATLIEHLYTHQLTWTCPHGRPVMVLVSVDSLAKMFHR